MVKWNQTSIKYSLDGSRWYCYDSEEWKLNRFLIGATGWVESYWLSIFDNQNGKPESKLLSSLNSAIIALWVSALV